MWLDQCDAASSDPFGVRHPRDTESLSAVPGGHDKDETGRALSLEVTGGSTWTSASTVTGCLGLSLCLNAIFYPSVHLSICLTTVCFVAVRPCLSVCQSVNLSVSSLQSNAPATLNVISFLTTLSLLSLRFQRSINNHIVKSKQYYYSSHLPRLKEGLYFNYLIAQTTCIKATVSS